MITIFASVAAHSAPGVGFGLAWILVPLFWLIVLGGLFALLRRRASRYHRLSPTIGAEGTLAGRFAEGDIDETEYRSRLEVLRATPPRR